QGAVARAEGRVLPLPQGQEVRGVGTEDGAVEGGLFRACVRALTHRRAAPPTQPVRRGHARGCRISLADIILAAFHELDGVAELTLVLVLQELLRGEQVGVTAPARERQGEVTLTDAWRSLDREYAWALGGVLFLDG